MASHGLTNSIYFGTKFSSIRASIIWMLCYTFWLCDYPLGNEDVICTIKSKNYYFSIIQKYSIIRICAVGFL